MNRNSAPPSEDPAINQNVFVHLDYPSLQLSLKLLRLRSNCRRTPAIPMKETHAMAPLMVRIPQQGFIPHEKEDKSTKKITRLDLVTKDHLGVLTSNKA